MILFLLLGTGIALSVFLMIGLPILFILAPTLFFFLLAVFALATMGVLGQGITVAIVLTVIAFIGLVVLKIKTGIDLTSIDWQDQVTAYFKK